MGRALVRERGSWWRFSNYELADGTIRPAENASLRRYDPWDGFRSSRSRGGSGEPPYQSLVKLVKTATFDSSGQPTSATKKAILSWCSLHGLLGVLLLEPTLPAVGIADGGEYKTPYMRFLEATVEAGRQLEAEESGHENDLVYQHCWYQGIWVTRLRKDDGKSWEGLRSYFPAVDHPEAGVASPLSPEFWSAYVEPVGEFLKQAGRLVSALEGLQTEPLFPDLMQPEGPPLSGESFVKGVGVTAGLCEINLLMQGVKSVLSIGVDGEYELISASPSLLGSYAMMVAEDLMDKRTLHECDACHTFFLSSAYQAKYCSDRCRWRHQKKRRAEENGKETE